MSGTLYVVGTPIGNLGDLSPRGLQTLADCDFIAFAADIAPNGSERHAQTAQPF